MEDDGLPRTHILTCWKEIASFFHREVRTVQRWEHEEGLPVHRHPHHRRSSVYAYPHELESWWAQHQAGIEPAGAEAGDPSAQPTQPIEAAPIVPAESSIATRPPGRAHLSRPSRWAVSGVILSLTILATAGLFLHGYGGAGPRDFPRFDVGTVASSYPIDIRSLEDMNGDGRGDIVAHLILGGETLIYFGSPDGTGDRRPDVRIVTTDPGHPSGGSVGDVDGDGLADLVVNVFLTEPASFAGTGPGYLIKGRRDWPAELHLPRDADAAFYVDLPSDIRMGVCSSPGGVDLNGDGLRDVVLGGGDYSPPGRPSAGGVFILFGRREWPKHVDVIAAADVTIHGSRTGEALRPSCSAGDFTGDGRTDLAVTATEDTLWYLQGAMGRVYVFAGAAAWPRLLEAERDATLQLQGSAPGAVINLPLLTDVNGDAIADLVAGLAYPDRGRPGGRVAVVLGGATRRGVLKDTDADQLMLGGPTFGSIVSAADANIDGCSDLIVTEPGTGSIHLVLGHSARATQERKAGRAPLLLVAGGRGTGAQGVAVGDMDGDGAPDFVLEVVPVQQKKGIRHLARFSPALPINIDVRPRVGPNVVLPRGVLAVEVSASSLLQDLDPTTLRLAGTEPTRLAWQDFDGNGSIELRLYFDAAQVHLPAGTTRVALRGRTKTGLPVSGTDDIVLIEATTPPDAGVSGVVRRPA